MNESWGYTKNKREHKDANDLILVLLKSVSSGGNLLLNIGPKPDGTIPEDQVDILKEIAVWMDDNKEAIHGTNANPFAEFFNWGYCTVKGTDVYLHVTEWDEGKTIAVPRLNNSIESVELLGDPDRKLSWKKNGKDVSITLTGDPVHSSASVIKLSCSGDELQIDPPQLSTSNGMVTLQTGYARSQGSRMRTLRHSIQEGEAVADLSQGHPSERLVWKFNVDRPGRYEVFASCQERETNTLNPRTIYLKIDDTDEYATEVTDTSLKDGRVNLGQVKITEAGSVSLSMRVEGGARSPLYLQALQLKIKE
jgi:alpha-L-fucosidase